MKVVPTRDTMRSMFLRGYRYAVIWDDGSRGYYSSKKRAISAMRREQAKKR